MNQNIKESIQKSKLDKQKPIVVALSGGVDSMVLFDALYRLEYKLIIAHVNHNKREESLDEYKNIERLAKEKNVPFEGKTLEDITNGNFQEVSRYMRYEFFHDICEKYNTNQVVLAHHNDDQIETVLMRLARGTSFGGYSGIHENSTFKDSIIYRPLLKVTKDEINKYAKQYNLQYFLDTTNLENVYTRNRFRNNIIPLLKEENPSLNEKINQFSNYINLADEFINKYLEKFTTKHIIDDKVDIHKFNGLDEILKYKVVQHIVNNATDNNVEVQYSQYNDIILLLQNDNPNITYNLAKGFELIKEYNYFYIHSHEETKRIFLEINAFGEYSISREITYVFSDKKLDIKHSSFFELWYNESVFPLYIRNKQNGDRIALNIGTKKVKDILIDKKVPARKRENLILLANNDKVMWIPRIKKSVQNTELPNKLYIYEVR